MNEINKGGAISKSSLEKWREEHPDAPKLRWMCRVLKDGAEYEHDRAVATSSVDDKERLKTATRENPCPSWGGRCVYWREERP